MCTFLTTYYHGDLSIKFNGIESISLCICVPISCLPSSPVFFLLPISVNLSWWQIYMYHLGSRRNISRNTRTIPISLFITLVCVCVCVCVLKSTDLMVGKIWKQHVIKSQYQVFKLLLLLCCSLKAHKPTHLENALMTTTFDTVLPLHTKIMSTWPSTTGYVGYKRLRTL